MLPLYCHSVGTLEIFTDVYWFFFFFFCCWYFCKPTHITWLHFPRFSYVSRQTVSFYAVYFNKISLSSKIMLPVRCKTAGGFCLLFIIKLKYLWWKIHVSEQTQIINTIKILDIRSPRLVWCLNTVRYK